jgi:predicted DNA-binding transcriptional regulator AlpA
MTLLDVQDELNISAAQAYALVRSGDLPAIKIGGRAIGGWSEPGLEEWVQRLYQQTAAWIKDHPFGRDEAAGATGDGQPGSAG